MVIDRLVLGVESKEEVAIDIDPLVLLAPFLDLVLSVRGVAPICFP